MRADVSVDSEDSAIASCRAVLRRLSALLEEESLALAARNIGHHTSFTERKNQLLRELIVAQRNCITPEAINALKIDTEALQKTVRRNQLLLTVHIEAVREVSAIIVDSIRQAESDGTYSRYA